MRALDAFGKCILAGGIAAALLASPGTAHARGYRILHFFTGDNGDGAFPHGVIKDSAGNLYGTTSEGGNLSNRGIIFKLAPDGTETVLYTFCSQSNCSDGAFPFGSLIRDGAGNLYGATTGGGTGGDGVVFELAPDGTETLLYKNWGASSGLIRDGAGNFYGTSGGGGRYGQGFVFKLAPDGTETVLHAFAGGISDGAQPEWGVIEDESDNLYGTTPYGGLGTCGQFLGCGIIYKIAPDGTETVLYRFGDADGAVPLAGLIMDKAGNFYGTTLYGGTGEEGVVYRFTADGKETVLYRFSGRGEVCSKGCSPFGELARDTAGNLYGVTSYGGKYDFGTVFRLAPDGTETVLQSFANLYSPSAGLIKDNAGNLYGTGESTVFKLRK